MIQPFLVPMSGEVTKPHPLIPLDGGVDGNEETGRKRLQRLTEPEQQSLYGLLTLFVRKIGFKRIARYPRTRPMGSA